MDPQQRTRLLGGILAVVVGVFVGKSFLNSLILDPISIKSAEIKRLDDQIEDANGKIESIALANRKLAKWRTQSLPPDTNQAADAQRLYKTWITNLVEITGFQDPIIEPGSRSDQKVSVGRRFKTLLYYSVKVKVRGKTTYAQLCRFLYYFHRTDLLHRVADLNIESEGNEGNPLMKVRLTVEALALAAAKKRSRIFPQIKLAADTDGDSLKVAATKEFPAKAPFQIRLGKRFYTISDRQGTSWKVRPGVDPPPDSESEDRPDSAAGSIVELNPMSILNDKTFAYYRSTVFGRRKNLFLLPIEYTPRLEIRGDTSISRGGSFQLRARTRDLDPTNGTPRFALDKDAPKGMTIDAKTGEIAWTPAQDDKTKSLRTAVLLYQGVSQKALLTETLRLEIRDPNSRPTINVANDNHEIFAGQRVAFQAKATDPDGQRLSYSLSSDSPAGASIDATTGEFDWTPDDDADPSTYTFDVIVTDSGSPSQSDRASVTITVKQKAERYTKLVGVYAEGGDREIWFYDIANNKKITLLEGSPFQVAGINGFLYVVGQDFIEFQSMGKSYRLALGKFLFQRQLLPTESPKKKPADKTTAGN